jgi:protein-disulfide isomerase
MIIHEQPERPALKIPVGPDDHILGPAAAPLELVEYGDYQCVHCIATHKVMTEILAEHPDLIRFVWRHFPLSKMHPLARLAAQAAEAAGEKFWEMHQFLFSTPRGLSRERMIQYAQLIGLNAAEFTVAMDSEAVYARVRAQMAGGIRSGVNTTPTFYIQGLRYNGGFNKAALLPAILEAPPKAGDNPSG